LMEVLILLTLSVSIDKYVVILVIYLSMFDFV
jgi:hypothetical protein